MCNEDGPLSVLSVRHLDVVKQGFISSKCERLHRVPRNVAAAAAAEPAENARTLEIVGPQHLAAFLRAALTASRLRWTYHVTELLPMGWPRTPIPDCPLHPNELAPSFIWPDEADGTYTVLEDVAGQPPGVTVRATARADREDRRCRDFFLAYTLTEPNRPGN